MKRASMNSQLDDEEARAIFKYRSLEQDYLAVQKEFVSKKRKLQAAQWKKETLLAEVKFLRQRHRCLSNVRSWVPELQEFPCSSSKTSVEDKNHRVHETVGNHNLVVAEDAKCGQQKGIQRPPRPVKKSKNGLIAGEKGKKKISWQDQVVTRVEFSETEL